MTVKQTVTALDTAIAELTDRLARQAEQLDRATQRVAELEQTAERAVARLARGTLTPEAPEQVEAAPRRARRTTVAPPTTTDTLGAELERVLRASALGQADLAALLGVPVGHVSIALRTLKRAGKVANAGTDEAPLWTWRIGDEGPTSEVNATVERLLRLRPMERAELVEITGARTNRVAGAIVHLQRSGAPIVQRRDGRRAKWFVLAANPAR